MPGVYRGTCLCEADSWKTTRVTKRDFWAAGESPGGKEDILHGIFSSRLKPAVPFVMMMSGESAIKSPMRSQLGDCSEAFSEELHLC